MKIISIDPGVHTGYCYAEVVPEKRLQFFSFEAVDDVDELWMRLHEFKPDTIVCEDFQFRRGKGATGGTVLFSVQLIGVARLYSLTGAQTRIYMQPAYAQGPTSYFNDARLKSLKVYKKNQPHAMSATKHLLHWAKFGAGGKIVDRAELLTTWERRSE